MCVYTISSQGDQDKKQLCEFSNCVCEPLPALCVSLCLMQSSVPLSSLYSLYSQLLLLAWESMVMWSSTRCGKDQPSFCSHCHLKQRTKENRISSTLEETPWQDWVHGSGKLATPAQTNCNNHHWQPTCALTTSALKNYIMWWRETVMLVVAMIDSFLCSLRRDVLLDELKLPIP